MTKCFDYMECGDPARCGSEGVCLRHEAEDLAASAQATQAVEPENEVIRLWNERARGFGFDGVAGLLNAMRHGELTRSAQAVEPAPIWLMKVADAYGHLWHVNNEPMAPIPIRSPEKAAYEARKILRDMLTHKQRGEAVTRIGRSLGFYEGPATQGASGADEGGQAMGVGE